MAERTPSEDSSAPGDEPLRHARERAVRALWLIATVGGVPVVLFNGWMALSRRPVASGMLIAVPTFFLALGVLTWARLRASRTAMTALVVLMAVVPVSGLVTLGPGLGPGAGFVGVGVLAVIFLGTRVAVLAWVGAAVAMAVGLASITHGDRTGFEAFWSGPRWLGIDGGTAVMIWMSIAMTCAVAVVRGLTKATEELRRALVRERQERDARIASELALAAHARLEAVGRLAAGVVHDTRNALTVLRAGLTELGAVRRGPEEREVLADMQAALAAAQETMNQLLTIGGARTASAEAVELRDQVERFSRAVSRLLPPAITVRLAPRAPGRAAVQPGLLDQALLNLCLNARDAMPEGGVLRLGVDRLAADGASLLVLEVEDCGGGLDPAVAAGLFQPFTTTKASGRGTGLGLTMVERFAASAGGRVEVRSVRGKGTCFRLVLPEDVPEQREAEA